MSAPLPGAVCAAGVHDPELWTGGSATGHVAAAALCMGCPARVACAARAESERCDPARMPYGEGGVVVRPFGVWAGLMYDGSERPPVAVRLSTPCASCGVAFVPRDSRTKYCPTHRVTKASRRAA